MHAGKRDLPSYALISYLILMRTHSAVLLLLLCLGYGLHAQPKGFRPVANVPAFQQSLAKSTAALQTLQSDFVQTKHLSLLADKITSKGKFYYRKEDKVRIEY